MKAKFLVPEIDRKRWAKEFKERMRLYELKSKDLNDIGASSNSEQRINKLKNGAIPLIEPFLALCRFFNCPPDVFLYANPKWVECEIDRSIDDIWPWRILGLYKDTCYLVPNYEIYDLGYEFTVGAKIKRLKKEPDPARYSNYNQWGTKYDLENRVAGGKIVYHFPYLDDEKTSAKNFFSFESTRPVKQASPKAAWLKHPVAFKQKMSARRFTYVAAVDNQGHL